jgi:hypothetical protein
MIDMTSSSRGSRQLREWLALTDTPTQRELARLVPGLSQPMISRHATVGRPTLRAAVVYRELVGVDPLDWLTAEDRARCQELRSRFAAESAGALEQAVAHLADALALVRGVRRAGGEHEGLLRSAENTLLAATTDLKWVVVEERNSPTTG